MLLFDGFAETVQNPADGIACRMFKPKDHNDQPDQLHNFHLIVVCWPIQIRLRHVHSHSIDCVLHFFLPGNAGHCLHPSLLPVEQFQNCHTG